MLRSKLEFFNHNIINDLEIHVNCNLIIKPAKAEFPTLMQRVRRFKEDAKGNFSTISNRTIKDTIAYEKYYTNV